MHVEEISSAIPAALAAPREVVHDEAFNIGVDHENYQVRELAEIVREATGGCEIEYAGTGDPDPRSYRVDFSKVARVFPDLEFAWTAASGSRQLAAAYRHYLQPPARLDWDTVVDRHKAICYDFDRQVAR